MRIYVVYTLTVEGSYLPFYVGKTYEGSARYNSHTFDARSGGRSIKAKIMRKAEKQGKSIQRQVVFTTFSETIALDKERELIAFYGRRNNHTGILANLTDGGEGVSGMKHSPETCAAISKRNKGMQTWLGRRHSEESRRKVSLTKTGVRNVSSFKPVEVYLLDGTYVGKYASILDAANTLNLNKNGISNHLCGRSKTVKRKYIFRRINEV